jgi:hypothetical protein
VVAEVAIGADQPSVLKWPWLKVHVVGLLSANTNVHRERHCNMQLTCVPHLYGLFLGDFCPLVAFRRGLFAQLSRKVNVSASATMHMTIMLRVLLTNGWPVAKRGCNDATVD